MHRNTQLEIIRLIVLAFKIHSIMWNKQFYNFICHNSYCKKISLTYLMWIADTCRCRLHVLICTCFMFGTGCSNLRCDLDIKIIIAR